MDKYELKVTISEIDSLISRRRFKDAAEVADSVDWRRVKNVRTLCRISDVYKINKRYHDSKRVLELAYAKSPYGRQIIFSLCELELKLGNYVRALQLYNEYINVAPRDADRYVLQYKLYKAQNVSINERIAVLEEMARYDFRGKWAYELAKLYLEASERTLCASECDEIIAFFGYGKYVYKALELKASFTELTVKQKALYRKMNGEEEEIPETESAPEPENEAEPAGAQEGDSQGEVLEGAGQKNPEAGSEDLFGEPAGSARTEGDSAEEKSEGTAAAQQEADSDSGISAEGPAESGSGLSGEGAAEADGRTGAQQSQDGQGSEPAEQKLSGEPAQQPAEPIPALNRDPETAEIPWEYEEYEVSPRELKRKKTADKDRGRSRRQDSLSKKSRNRAQAPERAAVSPAAPDHAVFEDYAFEVGGMDEPMFSQEKMQETVAKGLRDLENYDTVLMQETDGQYAMVMQEEPRPDKQITGQLSLEEIMREWEKVKRDFYESNGLDADEPEEPAEQTVKVPPMKGASGSGEDRPASSGTKSWDPREVHMALQIRDNDEGNAGYDTSLFVTEGGGDFPEEFTVEQMTLTTADRKRKPTGQMYLHSEDSIRQLTDALGRIFLEGGRGNVVITGDEGAGTLSLSRELVLRYRQINPNFVGQIAKSEGRYITRENVVRVIPRMPFGALIIERASQMSEEGAAALCEMLAVPERSILVIMIDRKGVMDAFLSDHPRLRDMFPARVDIAALSVDTLLGYAREYAGKQQCEIDEYGISALQSRIMSMQTVEHSVTLEDIRDIVDEAIYYASRKTISSLVDSFSRRKGGAQRIILRDKDFLHY